MSVLSIIGAAAGGILSRTFLVDTNTYNGVPKLLVVFDAITNEDPEFSATVTKNTVEDGTEVTDHIQIQNPTLSLKGEISNSPIDINDSIGNLLAGGFDLATSSQFRSNLLNTGVSQAGDLAGAALMGGASNPAAQGKSGDLDAVARSILLDAFEQKKRFDVVTKRQRYESMVIERLKFPRDQQTGFKLVFEVDMVRIRVVSPLQVKLTQVSEGNVTSATQKTALGGQSTKGVSDSVTGSVNKSWLRSIVGGLGG